MEENIVDKLIEESMVTEIIDDKKEVKISSNEQIMMSKAYILFTVDESGKLKFSMDTEDLNDMESVGFYNSVRSTVLSMCSGYDEYEDEVGDE